MFILTATLLPLIMTILSLIQNRFMPSTACSTTATQVFKMRRLPVTLHGRSLFMSHQESQGSTIPTASAGGATKDSLKRILATAFHSTFDEYPLQKDPQLIPTKPEYGDYQCNIAMVTAKELKMKPVEVAEKLKSYIMNGQAENSILEDINISGPGFLNFRLSTDYVKQRALKMLENPSRLGMDKVLDQQRVIVDYSSPNIAKEMHVGHLRSTIIGDTLARTIEFIGHDVLRLNHVGDWGTQFGMLINYLKELHPEAIEQYKAADSNKGDLNNDVAIKIGDLVEFYKAAKKKFDADPEFAETSRGEVVKLQRGDVDSVAAWKAICDVSRREFRIIYSMLDVQGLLERGESFYNPMLSETVDALTREGLAVESEGAMCIFLPGYTNPDGTPMPMIIKKSDGGFLYASTDLASVKHRTEVERAQRILYVTDAGQAQHFEMVFEAAKKAKYLLGNRLPGEVTLTHVPFGVVQGEDGKKFKSRSGDTVKLKDLLDEAVRLSEVDILSRKREQQDVADPSVELSPEEKRTARIVGIAAVKYADLSMNRESNYRFSYKKMLSLTGNTAPYMLYAYARIQGIRRKALADPSVSATLFEVQTALADSISFTEPEEIALAKHLDRFDETVYDVAKDLYPNKMCEYLFELSQKFNQFYEKCPVLKAETQKEKISRALLCALTADVLQVSLNLLGIAVVDQL